MELSNRYLLFVLAGLGAMSCIYFLCLISMIHIAIPLSIAAIALLYKWMIPDNSPDIYLKRPTSWLMLSVFTVGLGIISQNAINAAEKHGGWDAWAIWNLHSHYLRSPDLWKMMFRNVENDHPDYPLFLPAINAFGARITPDKASLVIPFIISMIVTIAAPALVFVEFMKRNLLVASLALFLFAYNTFYISCGTSQYADPWLGTFFLAAMICMDHVKENKKYIAFSAAFLGCCMWTKNEGTILAAIFLLFYANRFFARQYLKLTLTGIALPLITLVLFKTIVPTSNDMVSGLNAHTLNQIMERERYVIIYENFFRNLKEHFPYFKGIFITYMIMCFLRRKWPDKQMNIVLTCLITYNAIYLLTRYSVEWHVITSQDRLMAQLMPAMVYAFALKFAGNSTQQRDQFSFKIMQN